MHFSEIGLTGLTTRTTGRLSDLAELVKAKPSSGPRQPLSLDKLAVEVVFKAPLAASRNVLAKLKLRGAPTVASGRSARRG